MFSLALKVHSTNPAELSVLSSGTFLVSFISPVGIPSVCVGLALLPSGCVILLGNNNFVEWPLFTRPDCNWISLTVVSFLFSLFQPLNHPKILPPKNSRHIPNDLWKHWNMMSTSNSKLWKSTPQNFHIRSISHWLVLWDVSYSVLKEYYFDKAYCYLFILDTMEN